MLEFGEHIPRKVINVKGLMKKLFSKNVTSFALHLYLKDGCATKIEYYPDGRLKSVEYEYKPPEIRIDDDYRFANIEIVNELVKNSRKASA